jgi:aspartyl/asparaginyl-tRNA synthetase
MRRILAGQLSEYVGRRVLISGWLHRQRRLSRVTFLIVRDRSGLAQVVVGDRAQAEQLAELSPETVVSVTGRAVACAQAPGGVEVHDPDVEVVTRPAEPPPLELWRPTLAAQLPTRLDLAPLALRHPREQAMIAAATGEDLSDEPDLAPAHERWIGEWARREHGSELVFVTGYPMAKRPFYTHPDPVRTEFSNSFDLLFRGLELITGGQRLHRYEDYLEALAARGEDPLTYESYLQAFRYGMPPHGGFAIGLERWVSRLVGAANVRETTLFPRDRNRLTP